MTMPPGELNTEEMYREAKKMRGQLLAAVAELNELAAAVLAEVNEQQAAGEDSE
jgi:hypothetical protein